MLKRSHYIAMVLVALFVLALLSQSDWVAHGIRRLVGGLYLPFFGLANSTRSIADSASTALMSRPDLVKELLALRDENQRLKLEARQWDEAVKENNRLREALSLPQQAPWKLRSAVVVGRDPANWWRTIRINRGSRDGITNNLPVLSPQGFLVGRISETGYTHSQVVLLGDPDCRVSVLVESTRDHGVIAPSGGGPVDDSVVELKFLSGSSELTPGLWVRTSGLGGIFPKGILVGQVADVRRVQYGLHLEARVKLAARLSALEEVWVAWP
ncbi:MAG: rod shape-determining protein MreC [Verrucomicrobia bacterium]|nr:rod shape-determining protein MreC [Verrucomicrobiota bacterium]